MKRITLFILTNLAIIFVLNISLRLLGIDQLLPPGDFQVLLFAALFMGMFGAFLSLILSKWIAKMVTGAYVIDKPSNPVESWLINTVKVQSQTMGIGMPEVAIYKSSDLNAFATGMRRDHALVAVSTGLLDGMSEGEIEAVLGHEISHVANGDMVTLTLIQGVLNTFVIFFSRIIGRLIDQVIFKNRHSVGIAYLVTTMVAEFVLGLLASIIVMWFSRRREFYADAGAAKLVGSEKMIQALQRLQRAQAGELPEQLATFGIRGNRQRNLLHYLLLSHPPLEERIAALKENRYQ